MQEDFKRLFKHHLFKPQLSLIFSHMLKKLPCRADHTARFNKCTKNVKVTGGKRLKQEYGSNFLAPPLGITTNTMKERAALNKEEPATQVEILSRI